MPPAQRERWEVVRMINSNGGYCNSGIYLVRERATGKLAIEKRLTPGAIVEGYAQREIDALNQLQYKHITKLLDSYIDRNLMRGSIYLEYGDKGSLHELIEKHQRARKSFPEKFIWLVFVQLARAVEYCHEGPQNDQTAIDRQRALGYRWNVLAHRDIKTANVFLKSPEDISKVMDVLLGDFGCLTLWHLSRHASAQRQTYLV